jgi:hypothetical protein
MWIWLAVIATIHLPLAYEVIVQTVVQARLMRALSDEERRKLPAHPRPGLLWLASEEFFVALIRGVFDEQPGESPTVARLKRRLRVSVKRELHLMQAAVLVLAACACYMLVR